MIIDVHGHYTTAPQGLSDYRAWQQQNLHNPTKGSLNVTTMRFASPSSRSAQAAIRSRNRSCAFLSDGRRNVTPHWRRPREPLLDRDRQRPGLPRLQLFPENFVPVCQLPQSPRVPASNCIEELERCVNELGFVGLQLNPDPSDGYWIDPPMTDKHWYPLYEKMVELEVPAMIHVSGSCNPELPRDRGHYLNGDLRCLCSVFRSRRSSKISRP